MRRIKSVVPLKLPVKNRPLKADNGGVRPCLKTFGGEAQR